MKQPRFLLLPALLLTWLSPDEGRAQARSEPPVAPAVTQAVAREAATRWGTSPDRIEVEWRAGPALPADGAVRLVGSGASGSFVARVERNGRTASRRVRLGVRISLPVAARDLARGTELAGADVVFRDTVTWGPPPAVDSPVGWEVRRRLVAGSILAPPAVAPPPAVVAGTAVTVVWRGGRLEVSTVGTAAGTAAEGERVAVRTESGERIWGIAEGPGLIRVEGRTR